MTQNKNNLTSVTISKKLNWFYFIFVNGGGLDDGIKQRNECVCVTWMVRRKTQNWTDVCIVGFFPSPDIRSRPVRQTSPHFGARTSNSGPEVTSQQTTYETTTGTPPDPEQEDIVVERALTFDALSFSINRHGPKVWLQFFKHKDTTNIDMVVKIIDATVNWHWIGMVNLLFSFSILWKLKFL